MRHAKVLDERSTKKRNKKKTHATNCRIAQAYSMHADTIYNIKTNIDFTSAVGYILFDGGGARCTAFIQQEHDSFIHIFSSVNSIAAWMLCDVLRYMCHEWQTNNTNWVWTTGFFFSLRVPKTFHSYTKTIEEVSCVVLVLLLLKRSIFSFHRKRENPFLWTKNEGA